MKYILKKIPKNPIIIGKICKSYGINGLVYFSPFINFENNIFKYKILYIKKKKWKIIFLKYYINKKKKKIIKIKNINNKSQIKLLFNNYVYIDFIKFENFDYYYLKDIVKCIVVNNNNFKLGKIKKVYKIKLNYIILIKKKEKEFIVPFIKKKIVKKIDIELKIIKLNLNLF